MIGEKFRDHFHILELRSGFILTPVYQHDCSRRQQILQVWLLTGAGGKYTLHQVTERRGKREESELELTDTNNLCVSLLLAILRLIGCNLAIT